MADLRIPSVLLVLSIVAASCSLADFYDDREYVLYESKPPAPHGSPERIAADADAAEADPDAAEAPAAADVERIFVLENLRDELDRALADELGEAAVLQQKRADVEREIQWRRRELGDAYVEARKARLQRLMGFPVLVR